MNKTAQIQGTLAAFADMGIIKVASEDAFMDFTNQVEEYVGDDTSMQKIAEAVKVLVYDANDGFKKQASEDERLREYKEALGDLVMMKTAGKINDEIFVKVSADLLKQAFGGCAAKPIDAVNCAATKAPAKPEPGKQAQPKPEANTNKKA